MGKWRGPPGSQGQRPENINNYIINKPWREAIDKALKRYERESDDPKRAIKRGEALFKVANELVESALDRKDPNFQFAVKEIGLRQDGKPIETVELGDTTQKALGISAALNLLSQFTAEPKVVSGETIVQDRPVLPDKVCAEEGGHSEGVDISKVSGHTGES